MHALRKLRRALIFVATNYGYFLIAFAIWRRGSEIPDQTKWITLIGFVFNLIGVIFFQKELGLWITILSLVLVTFYLVVDPIAQRPWIQLSVLLALVSLSNVFMFWGQHLWRYILLESLITLFNFVSYFHGAITLLPTGSFLGRGSISSVMLISTWAYSLYGWSRMISRAKANDEKLQNLIEDYSAHEQAQKSQRFWRELVIRVHETTLNTLRSLLTLRDVPIENLRKELLNSLSANRTLVNSAHERRAGSIIGAIRSGIDSAAVAERVRLVSQGVNFHLDSQISQVIERVVREALRNAIEHADAKNIEILWRTSTLPSLDLDEREQGRVWITITDDGKGKANIIHGGIGTNLIMAKSIRELGGTFSIENRNLNKTGNLDDESESTSESKNGTVVKIELPTSNIKTSADPLDLPSFSAVDLGRYMALLTLFGPAMTGIAFFPILGIWWPGQSLSEICGITGLVLILYTTFVRMVRLGWWSSIAAASCLLGSIYFLNLPALDCPSTQPFQWVINSVVYGLFIVCIWGKWQVVLLSYPIFLLLVRQFHKLIPDKCNFIFNFPLINTLFSFLFVAIVFFLVYKSFERFDSIQEARKNQNVTIVNEIERNDAAFETILNLDSLARQTIQTLSEQTGTLDAESRHTLRLLDAQLRSEMQVDPVASQGLTLLANEFVREAAKCNRWLDVKSIHGDDDPEEIPQIVKERFLAIAREVSSGASIQLVLNEGEAELSIRSKGAIPEAVRNFENTMSELGGHPLSARISRSSADEYVCFLKRGKPSQ